MHKQKLKETATHHWHGKKLMMRNRVYAHFCFSVLVRFQGLIPLFRFPSLASCSRQANKFCVKLATGFGKISHRLWENQRPTLGKKLATGFGKISHRLWENQRPTLGKSETDFGKMSHRLRENQPPTLGKSATDFGKK